MAVGNPVDTGGLNTQLGSCAVSMRDAMRAATDLWAYVVSLGADQAAQTAALVSLGFSSSDAAAFWLQGNHMFAVAQVYFGQGTQGSAFNFDSALAGVRGPT